MLRAYKFEMRIDCGLRMSNPGYAAGLQISGIVTRERSRTGICREPILSGRKRQIRVTQTPQIRLTTTRPRRIVMAVQILHSSLFVYVKTV